MKKYTLFKFLLPAAVLGCVHAHAQNTIETFAGNGVATFAGDNGQATQASLNFPASVVVSPTGEVYIADQYNNRVRKVALGGVITTVAGTGNMGYSGNGSYALSANLEYPDGVSLDAAGNLYITEWFADDVRQVNLAGIINPFCGNGQQGGDGDGGPGIAARMEVPHAGVADAAGNMYIPDIGNSKIRKLDAATGIVTTFMSFSTISGVCLDGMGNLYVSAAAQIYKVNINSGVATLFAGTGVAGFSGDGGLATNATFSNPQGMSVGPDGTLYVADYGNNRVRAISYVENIGYVVNTIAGNGTAGFSGDQGLAINAQLSHPNSVYFYGTSDLYIADQGNNRIRKVILAVPKATHVNTLGTGVETIYPNPSTGSFTFQADAATLGSSFEIYDVAGRSVYSGNIAEVQTKINLQNQPAGVYTMRISNGKVQRITVAK